MTDRVLVIGVDAGSFGTLDRLIDGGDLPAIRDLVDGGRADALRSSVPPWTPSAWTSLTTGTNPGKHGVFDFKTTDQRRLVNSGDVAGNRIWDYLEADGKPSIVVNVPVTHPAPSGDGVLVPGYLGPEADEAVARPEGMLEELRDNIGEYRIYRSGESDTDEEICEEYRRLLQMRADATVYLCSNFDWEFTMVQFQRTDTVFHELPEREYIDEVYRTLDECVGRLRSELDPDTTLLVSDHGMKQLGDWDFRINSWLQQHGYLTTSPDGYHPGWTKPGGHTGDSSALERPLAAAANYGLTAQRIERVLDRVGVRSTVGRLIPDRLLATVAEAGGEKIDRERSSAYCPSGPGLGIYCDDDVVDPIVSELEALEDPDGRAVFQWVRPAEEVLDGPQADAGPDVFALPREMEYFVSGTLGTSVFEPSHHRFNHAVEGVCIASGEHVEQTDSRGVIDITDVAPAVLRMMGVPLDPQFDGEAPEWLSAGIDHPGTQEYETETTGATAESYAAVEERLDDLGYMS